MPRKKTSPSSGKARNRNARKGGGGSSAMKYVMIGGGIVAVGLIVWLVLAIVLKPSHHYRDSLDKYVEVTDIPFSELKEGAGIYLDMSDGMNFAYATPESQNVLKAVINKLAAVKGVNFYALAEDHITPLDYNHTTLYNYMLNAANYDKQRAPIEKTIDQIVTADQPALLMTDFEEYNGGLIQKAAYAKRGFIDWLSKGNNIIFYKWDFTEKGKDKHMFIAVFDNNANRLNNLVAQAISGVPNSGIAQFVVGSKDFYFPMWAGYDSVNRGGNYHDGDDGIDLVTAIPDADSNNEYAYHSYFSLVADAAGKGNFHPMQTQEGYPAEFYPLGVSWADAVRNANDMANSTGHAKYEHLLSKLYVDFDAQSGFDVEKIELRVFDIQNSLDSIGAHSDYKTEQTKKMVDAIMNKELTQFLTASMKEVTTPNNQEYDEITVDFHPRFNGTITGIGAPGNLVRANVVISETELETGKINEFFSWGDNNSLAESVKLALQSPACNLTGRVIFSYYFVAPEGK